MSSNVPPRAHSTLGTIISTIRQGTANLTTNAIATVSNTNNVFVLVAFNGHGADLLRQETADPSSDLRLVFQSACEYDVTEMIRHLGVSVHAVRAIGGAPATNLVVKQKFVDSASDPSTGNRLHCEKSLFCAVSVRTTSPQQTSALVISLRASLPNPHNYRHVSKLIAKVCRSRPTRLYADVKARTPYQSALFVSLHKIEEIPQNFQHQPRWYIDFFAAPSHMIHPGQVERFLLDQETARERATTMMTTMMSGSLQQRQQGQQTLHLNYSAAHQQQNYQEQIIEQRREQHQQQQQQQRQNEYYLGGGGGIVYVSDSDAMFVPSKNASSGTLTTNALSAAVVARAMASREPILISRTRL